MRIEDFVSLLRPLSTRVANLVARAVVRNVDDTAKLQLLQLDLLHTETRDEIEHFQNYGFTSNPKPEAEAVIVFVNGRREHGLAIAVDDRRYRVKNLESGEVAVYDATGSTVVLKANGDIEVHPSSGTVKFTGDVTVSGTLTATSDVVGGGKSLKNHTHTQGTLVAPSGGGPVTGTTGAPI